MISEYILFEKISRDGEIFENAPEFLASEDDGSFGGFSYTRPAKTVNRQVYKGVYAFLAHRSSFSVGKGHLI